MHKPYTDNAILTQQQQCEFTLPVTQRPERLDKVLSALMNNHSRARIQGWIESGHVLVNNSKARVRQKVLPGDYIVVFPQPDKSDMAFKPEPIQLEVIAETSQWIVINKPAGMVTHPGAGNWSGTLLNGLIHKYPELTELPRAGIVHRLDKDTSGLLVVARTQLAQTSLVRQLQERTVGREYKALVHGRLEGRGTVDLEIGRDRRVAVRMTTNNPIAPKEALTSFEVHTPNGSYMGIQASEVLCRLHTGRTHQIRVHMAAIGHPLLGDITYGGKTFNICKRQMLHAWRLSFHDIDSNSVMEFEASTPQDYANLKSELWNT